MHRGEKNETSVTVKTKSKNDVCTHRYVQTKNEVTLFFKNFFKNGRNSRYYFFRRKQSYMGIKKTKYVYQVFGIVRDTIIFVVENSLSEYSRNF